MDKRDVIISKSKNIGSLCLFLNSKRNEDYLIYLFDNTPDSPILPERVYCLVNNISEIPLCICGENRKFIGLKNGWRETCSKKECVIQSRKDTNTKKYGFDNPLKSSVIRDKSKNTLIEKYGFDHPMRVDSIKEKQKATMFDKWGVVYAMQNDALVKKGIETFNSNPNRDEIIQTRRNSLLSKSMDEKEKIINKKNITKIEKYGSLVEYNKLVQDRIRETSKIKWGTDHHLSSPEIIRKRVESYMGKKTSKIMDMLPDWIGYLGTGYNKNETDLVIELHCSRCDSKFSSGRQLLYLRTMNNIDPCIICNPPFLGVSNKEIELRDWIMGIYSGEIISNSKEVIKNGELDIYLPDKKIAIEFNGLWWHSDEYKPKKYHLDKTMKCRDEDIDLIHIWEDDWDHKKDIVKSIISNKIGLSSKIWARKCIVREIEKKESKIFLDENHIQGDSISSKRYGLFQDGELVSVMTFSKTRKSLGSTSIDGEWELVRFCNKKFHSVVGGASKLIKRFINDNKPAKIISYSDSSRGVGNLYLNLGFEFSHDTEPNYYWIVGEKRMHRYSFRKDVLVKKGHDPNKTEVEIMWDLGHRRTFDCGSKKWILQISKQENNF